ncbi:hypothetical protein [Kineococcus indalonis]|uniref:hypothetical protein n=1 Tax=Kineococcus indalonis TaxID=2696566 RepID=UPI0014123B98|nr:hypothetical protein [Kineococcus indalonis]NAZ87282.1 hypothetical protein [Kineococcus indalonis]
MNQAPGEGGTADQHAPGGPVDEAPLEQSPSGQSPLEEVPLEEAPLVQPPLAQRLPLPHAGTAVAQPWRQRALALRRTLPQLARNPVVVSASTVAVTVAARLAVEVARRALSGSSAGAPVRVEVSGHVMHHVHVVQHVHVVHHATSPIGWPALSAPPRR